MSEYSQFDLQYFDQKMKTIILIALAIIAAIAQQTTTNCQICAQVQTCARELFSDADIDLVYTSLIKQLKLNIPPIEISRTTNSSHKNYTFRWVSQVYVAVVELASRNYKVFSLGEQKVQNTMSSGVYMTINKQQFSLLQKIDAQIRRLYGLSKEDKCISLNNENEIYRAKYCRVDGRIVTIDVKVAQDKAGVITFTVINQQNIEVESKTVQAQVNLQRNTQEVVQQPRAAQPVRRQVTQQIQAEPIRQQVPQPPSQPAPQPISGGYSKIQPNSDANVITIINFLTSKFGDAFKLLKITTIERQVVSGLNYRLTASFDSTSNARYVIVVYQTLQGQLSISSADLVNVPSTYSFVNSYQASEANKISYFTLILNTLAAKGDISKDAVLQTFSINYPYFQLTFKSQTFSKLTLTISFDVLKNILNVLNAEGLPYPVKVEQPKPIVPQPQKKVQPTPVVSKPKVTPSKVCIDDGVSYAIELISQELKGSDWFKKYTRHFISQHVDQKQALFAIYCKVQDTNEYVFRVKREDGSFRDEVFTKNYVLNLLNKLSRLNVQQEIDNCLDQEGDICLRCAYSFYLLNGKCNSVPSECSDFNYKSLKCQGCYHGYYLDLSATCKLADYLCRTSDRKGNCVTCFKDYRLTAGGKCAYKAEGAEYGLQEQESNPLCSKFKKSKCLSCVQGCYMNKQGLCKIPDPNCHKFNQENEICTICMQGYNLSSSSKTCVPNRSYC